MQMAFFMGIGWCLLQALRPHLSKRKYWILLAVIPGTAAASILGSSSRGSQLAALCVVLAILVMNRIRLRYLLAGALVVLAGWQILPAEQKARFESMGSDETSESRLDLWADARRVASNNPVFGIGFANWSEYMMVERGERTEAVHNTLLQAAVELGYPGAALFLLLVVASFVTNAKTRRRAKPLGEWGRVFTAMSVGLDVGMVGLLVASLFMSVLFYPMFWMSFGMTTALAAAVQRTGRSRIAQPAIRRHPLHGMSSTGLPPWNPVSPQPRGESSGFPP
jgi:O-antigen ligase